MEERRRDGTRSMWRDRGEMETRYFSLNPIDSFLDTLNAKINRQQYKLVLILTAYEEITRQKYNKHAVQQRFFTTLTTSTSVNDCNF